MFPRKPHRETPIERMFRQVFRRNMNRAERRYFLRRPKAKPKRLLTEFAAGGLYRINGSVPGIDSPSG